MIQEAVAFCKIFANTLSISLQPPTIGLNSLLNYQQWDQNSKKKLSKTIQMFSDRQIQLQLIFKEIVSKQQMISSIKIAPSPQKELSLTPKHKPTLQNIQEIQTDLKKQIKYQEQVKRVEPKDLSEVTQLTQQTQKPIKLVTFKITQDDKESTISTPSVSRNVGFLNSLTNRMCNIVQCNPKCMDFCYGGPSSQSRTEPYEVQVTEREMRKMVKSKNVPK